jgi:hypothetical protein
MGDRRVDVNRGTPALLAACCAACRCLGIPAPYAYLVGDTGPGRGSRKLYRHLADNLSQAGLSTLVFHYLQPDSDWHDKVLLAIREMPVRPRLIADAGFMYAAKMSGRAPEYDLFTPDVGELAFLADEDAPHPFYTRGFILHEDNRVPDLIARAYEHDNAARMLLVKGAVDRVAGAEGMIAEMSEPVCEAMEAVGGTGDTLTGLAAVLVEAGLEMGKACLVAARANRMAGHLADPTPATQVGEIVARIPEALAQAMEDNATPQATANTFF